MICFIQLYPVVKSCIPTKVAYWFCSLIGIDASFPYFLFVVDFANSVIRLSLK